MNNVVPSNGFLPLCAGIFVQPLAATGSPGQVNPFASSFEFGSGSPQAAVRSGGSKWFGPLGRLFGKGRDNPPDLGDKDGEGVQLTSLLAYLTSGQKFPSEESLIRAMEKGGDGLAQLIESSRGNREYWEEILERYYVSSQFARSSRSIVELATNGIDTTLRCRKKEPVNIELSDGKVTISDSGEGMNLSTIFSKLLVPSLTSNEEASDVNVIGRFGIGFYSVLDYLQSAEDRVVVETVCEKRRSRIVFWRSDTGLKVSVSTIKDPKGKNGTTVSVRSGLIKDNGVGEMLRSTLEYYEHLPIYINGEHINPKLLLAVIEGGGCKLRYSHGLSANGGKLAATVNGIKVFEIPISGSNIPSLLVFDFPPDTPLPVSRNSIEATQKTIKAVINLIDQIQPGSGTATLLNGLWPLIKYLQAKNSSFLASDDLTLVFKNHVVRLLKGHGVYVPDEKEIQTYPVRSMLVDPEIFDQELLKGSEPFTDFLVSGAKVIIGPMPAMNGEEPWITRQGDVIVISGRMLPKNFIERAVLAAWIETTGAKVLFADAAIVQDTASADIGTYQRVRQRVQSMSPASYAKVFEHPVTKPLFEKLALKFIDGYRSETELDHAYMGIVSALKPLLDEDVTHHPWLTQFAERIIGIISRSTGSFDGKCTPDVKNSSMIFWRYAFRQIPDLVRIVEAELCPDDAKILRIFINGKPNGAILRRVYAIMDSLCKDSDLSKGKLKLPFLLKMKLARLKIKARTNQRLISEIIAGDEGGGLAYWEGATFGDEAAEIAKKCIWNCTSPMNIKNGSAARKLADIFEAVLKRWQASRYDDEVLVTGYRRFQAIFNFVTSGEQGLALFLDQDEWEKWEKTIVDNNPFMPMGELEHTIGIGYKMLDGRLGEVYDLFQGKKKGLFRDFIQFAGAVAAHYYQGKPPIEFVDRCLKIWKNRMLRLNISEYEKLREGFYLMFAYGADEVFLNRDLQPYVSYVLGEIPEIPDLETTSVRELDKAATNSFLLSSYVAEYLAEGRNEQSGLGAKFALRAVGQAINDQSSDPAIYVRELIQNSIDEAVKRNAPPEMRRMKIEARKSQNGELVASFADPFGMTEDVVRNFLLIPGRSSKKDEKDQIGRFGQGFFALFKIAKKVTLRTRRDGDVSIEMEFTPIKDPKGRVVDVQVKQRISNDQSVDVGTRIEITEDSPAVDIDAAFLYAFVIRYAGVLPESRMVVEFNEAKVNRPLPLVYSENTKLGEINIYAGAESPILTQCLYVKHLNGEYLEVLPAMLKRLALRKGIVIDIPPQIELIRDRSDIAKKENIVPLIRNAILMCLLKEAIDSLLKGEFAFDILPYDLFDKITSYQFSRTILSDAESITLGRDVDLSGYSTEDKIAQLLISLPVIPIKGDERKYSLMEVIRRYKEQSVSIDDLPDPVAAYLRAQEVFWARVKEGGSEEFEKHGVESTSKIDLPEEIDPRADAYWAFIELTDAIGQLMNRSLDSGLKFYNAQYYFSERPAMASVQALLGIVGWNLTYAADLIQKLGAYLRHEIDEDRFIEVLKNIIETLTHEQTHIFEKVDDDDDITHDRKFFDSQRQLLRFLRDNVKELEEILAGIRGRYEGTYIPPREFMQIIRP